jgi:hypothetical protein
MRDLAFDFRENAMTTRLTRNENEMAYNKMLSGYGLNAMNDSTPSSSSLGTR